MKDNFSTLWIGKSLPTVQQICLSSYVYYDQPINLYSYENIVGIPDGVNVLDANLILPEDKIFKIFDSYACFSDYFRYKLLSMVNTIWVDADHMSLSKNWGTEEVEYFYGVQKEYSEIGKINNGVLKYPKDSELAKKLIFECEALIDKKEQTSWGDTGPKLLTKIINELELNKFAINKNKIYPINWDKRDNAQDIKTMFISDFLEKEKFKPMLEFLDKHKSFSLTFWNNVFKQIIEESVPEKGSFFEYVYNKYLLKPKKQYPRSTKNLNKT
jgi:hypothetical protein